MKCKKCGYKMSKLYRLINHRPYKIPIAWYCKDCDKIGNRIKLRKKLTKKENGKNRDKHKPKEKVTQIWTDSLGGYKIIKK